MQKYDKRHAIPAICGVLAISGIVLSGCGQKDATPADALPPPATIQPAPVVGPATSAVPPGGILSHRATLQAQSDYWRKHGQGLNEVPHTKPKQ